MAGQVQFLNAKSEPLWIEALKADDLWGFLGKRDNEPSGPKRKIQADRLAILDVYFKKKFPNIALAFGKKDVSLELSNTIKFFYPSIVSNDQFAEKFKNWSGLYISQSELASVVINRESPAGYPYKFIVSAMILQYIEERKYFIAHKIDMPLRLKYLNEDSLGKNLIKSVADTLKRGTKDETVIFSGIGLASNSGKELVCMLRDRTTYDPYFAKFDISFENIE